MIPPTKMLQHFLLLLAISALIPLTLCAQTIPSGAAIDARVGGIMAQTGAKGMGEGGTIGAPAAVLGAINDALSDTEARFDHIPVLPHDVSAVLNQAVLNRRDAP